jgi:hypothetical protein
MYRPKRFKRNLGEGRVFNLQMPVLSSTAIGVE